jgi:hypothetical protein
MTLKMHKNFIALFLIVPALFFTLSCERTQKEEQATSTPEDTSEVYLQTIRSIDEYSNKLQLLVKSDTGVIRGVNFNTPLSEVLKIEDTNVFEKKEDSLSLEVDLDSTEIADVVYKLDENERVKDIRIELYLKDDQSLNSLATEFVDYYSAKYGPAQEKDTKHYVWPLPGNRSLSLQFIKEGIDRGIVLQAQ